MNLIEYWKEFIFVATLIISFFTGRKSKEYKEKTEGADAISALQKVYDTYIEHNKKVTEELLNRVNSLEKHNRNLQKQFNDISFSYTNVVDENKKIEAKYKELSKDYEALKTAHENLSREFEDYKRKIKIIK